MSEQNPDWNDATLGTRVRVALWLRDEVGEGNTFNRHALREAIPGVEQVDRRMRDLRPAGWVILTYRELPRLQPNELLLESIGLPVWDPDYRSAGLRNISAKTRQAIFERDNHRCLRCGVTAGEEYPDAPGAFARLTLGHVRPHKYRGDALEQGLVTECARCNEGVQHLTAARLDSEQVWDRIASLSKKEKETLLEWMVADRRPATGLELAWYLFRQLPADGRGVLRRRLGRRLAD